MLTYAQRSYRVRPQLLLLSRAQGGEDIICCPRDRMHTQPKPRAVGFQSILSVRRVGRRGSRRMSSKPNLAGISCIFQDVFSHFLSFRLDTAAIVTFQRCLEPGCYRNPHYGVSRLIDPNSKAQYCTKHKAPGELFTRFQLQDFCVV